MLFVVITVWGFLGASALLVCCCMGGVVYFDNRGYTAVETAVVEKHNKPSTTDRHALHL